MATNEVAIKAVVSWLRSHGGMFSFSTADARVTGVGRTYTSTALGKIAGRDKTGLRQDGMGRWTYDPEYDEGMVNKSARVTAEPRHRNGDNMRSVVQFMRTHPGEVMTGASLAARSGGDLLPGSAATALSRLAQDHPDLGIRKLTRGVYIYEPGSAAHDAEVSFSDLLVPQAPPEINAQAPSAKPGYGDMMQREEAEEEEPSLEVGDVLEVAALGREGDVYAKSAGGRLYKLEEM